MIDAHCHLTHFSEPVDPATVSVIVVAVTNDLEEFEFVSERYRGNKWVRVALGLHPLHVAQKSPGQIERFLESIGSARFIGEIGLDRSAAGRSSYESQRIVFQAVVPQLRSGQFISVHSRDSADQVAEILSLLSCPPVVMHWYSGSRKTAGELVRGGHLFSVNSTMLRSRRGRELLEVVPPDRILIESDAPYGGARTATSWAEGLQSVARYLAGQWQSSPASAVQQVGRNVMRLLDKPAAS